MNAEIVRTMVEYNYAAHRRLWDSITYLTDAQFVQDVDYSIGSVRNHMVHLINVDSRWLARLQHAPVPDRLMNDDFTTVEATRRKWAAVEAAVLSYAAAVSDADLNELIHYDMPSRGGARSNTRWEITLHMVVHGADHRAQVLPILHPLGAPTFEQDFILYLWDKGN